MNGSIIVIPTINSRLSVTGLYRINQPTLSAIGLGGAQAEQFQLWRNGEQVPIYTSVQTGPLGPSDYIEFWGEMNDGKPDKALYRDPDYQLIDKWNCQTDTASFLPDGKYFRFKFPFESTRIMMSVRMYCCPNLFSCIRQ